MMIEETNRSAVVEVGKIKSKLAYYSIADNIHDLVAEADGALEPLREKLAAEYSILQLLGQASIRIARVDEAMFYSPSAVANMILPTLVDS
ncbi:MAG: hypothetical protein AB7G93_22060 [Bdellovibrionales bacterium]